MILFNGCVHDGEHSETIDYLFFDDDQAFGDGIGPGGGNGDLIQITSPNTGSIWHENTEHTVTWVTSGDIGGENVKIGLSMDAGETWYDLDGSHPLPSPFAWVYGCYYGCEYDIYDWGDYPNIGEATWQKPDINNDPFSHSGNQLNITNTSEYALIGIFSATKPNQHYDIIDSYMKIVADSNYYSILSPNGGEEVQMGTSLPIIWESGGNINNVVKLYYSQFNGDSWYLIDENATNDGSYTWTVPTLQSDNPNCLIKIVDGSNDAWFDISDATFTIVE